MTRARRLAITAACALGIWPAALAPSARSAPRCALTMRTLVTLPGRIDTLLTTSSGLVVALVGVPSATIRFLPHDDLLVLRLPDGTLRNRVVLPPYIAAPGLAVASDAGGPVAVVVDTTLLRLDGRHGRLVARQTLDMTAVGWPAAVAAGPGGQVYVAGQPVNAWAARVDALAFGPAGRPRLRWRAPLGLTHAGIWLGLAGSNLLAAYLPDAADQHGTIALLDIRTGDLRGSYAVPGPPLAADSQRGILYLASGGRIEARRLGSGELVASVPGEPPLALGLPRGLVAFMRGGKMVLASASNLGMVTSLPLPGVSALTFTGDGTSLVVGQGRRMAQAPLGECRGRG